jgi:hypothetical protein
MESGRTHRDTLAFVLTIVGATAWSIFPVGSILQAHTVERVAALLTITTVGAFLGGWSAGTVWNRVPLATAAVAGALCAAVVVGVLDLQCPVETSVGLREIAMMAGVTAAAAGGASLGRRMTTPRTSLVAAWITISSIALFGVVIGVVDALGYEVTDDVGGVIVLVGGLPGAIAAMILTGGYERRPTAWRLVILAVSAFLIVAFGGPDTEARRDGAIGGALIGVVLAAQVAIAHWLVYAVSDRWIRPEVPAAKVVER